MISDAGDPGDAVRDSSGQRPKLGGSGLTWSSPQDWERAKRREFCAICLDGGPSNVLVPLNASFATGAPTAPLPGYVCVVARRHVVEPFDLPSPELQQFWQDAMIVGRALSQLLRPAKINYEIHGNSMPHLHMHIYPRSAGDPYVGRSIAWDAVFERSTADLRDIRDAIEQECAAFGSPPAPAGVPRPHPGLGSEMAVKTCGVVVIPSRRHPRA